MMHGVWNHLHLSRTSWKAVVGLPTPPPETRNWVSEPSNCQHKFQSLRKPSKKRQTLPIINSEALKLIKNHQHASKMTPKWLPKSTSEGFQNQSWSELAENTDFDTSLTRNHYFLMPRGSQFEPWSLEKSIKKLMQDLQNKGKKVSKAAKKVPSATWPVDHHDD